MARLAVGSILLLGWLLNSSSTPTATAQDEIAAASSRGHGGGGDECMVGGLDEGARRACKLGRFRGNLGRSCGDECLDGEDATDRDSMSRAGISPEWRMVQDTDGKLWQTISDRDWLEFAHRPRISVEEISYAHGHGCIPRSVCGMWSAVGYATALIELENGKYALDRPEGGGLGNCADLCIEKEFWPMTGGKRLIVKEDEEASLFQQMLHNLQFPMHEEFDATQMRPTKAPVTGFGVSMTYAAHELARSVTAGRVWVPIRQSLEAWTTKEWCGEERSLRCYFLPPTNVSIDVIDARGSTLHLPVDSLSDEGVDEIAHDFAPPRFAHRGSFWLLSQCLHFIWQPNGRTMRYVQEIRKEMSSLDGNFAFPFRQQTIGMHVRRGDSFLAGRWMPSLDVYLEHARRMKRLYGVNHIFLSTDCEDTVRQCAEMSEFECAALPFDREMYDVGARHAAEYNSQESRHEDWIENRVLRGDVDGSKAALQAIADIDTLAGCDYFIGRLDSSFSRLALMLIGARRGPVPYVSISKAWAKPSVVIN